MQLYSVLLIMRDGGYAEFAVFYVFHSVYIKACNEMSCRLWIGLHEHQYRVRSLKRLGIVFYENGCHVFKTYPTDSCALRHSYFVTSRAYVVSRMLSLII